MGAAGGDLTGTYPDPQVVDDSHNHSALTLTGVLPLTGGTLTGMLLLPATTPTDVGHAASKGYVDSRIWKGTQAEYDALGTYDPDVLYVVKD